MTGWLHDRHGITAAWLGPWQRHTYLLLGLMALAMPLLLPGSVEVWSSGSTAQCIYYFAYPGAGVVYCLFAWGVYRGLVYHATVVSILITSWTAFGVWHIGIVPALFGIPFLLAPLLLFAPSVALAYNGLSVATVVAVILSTIPENAVAVRLAVFYVVGFGVVVVGVRSVFFQRAKMSSAEARVEVHAQVTATLERNTAVMLAMLEEDMRAPIRTLLTLTEELAREEPSHDSQELRQLARHIQAVVGDLVEDSVELDEPSSAPPEEVLCVSMIVDRLLLGCRDMASDRGVMIRSLGHFDPDERHRGSERAIRQIVQNLVKNAVLHSDAHTVTVTVTRRVADSSSDAFSVTVADSGKGIPEAFRERMFEQGSRAESDADGLGLGLYPARQMALSLPQGDLRYVSHPAGGARFELTFSLPRVDVIDDEAALTERDLLALLKDQAILLVDDSALQRRLAHRALIEVGARVTEVANAQDALSEISVHSYDIILTDIFMPGRTGHDLLTDSRREGFVGPVIGMNNTDKSLEAQTFVDEGGVGVLTKPLQAEDLARLLRRYRRDRLIARDPSSSTVERAVS